MTTTITSGGSAISALITAYESERETRSIVHEILSNSTADITLRPSGLRTGNLTLTFTGPDAEANSAAAEALLAVGSVCSLASTDRATVNMSFVRPDGGHIGRTIGATLATWLVSFDWQEVPA
ncbi:hypothetical protein IC744_14035 [Microbacterium hominis]|uniref:hypothetical protein n=1 Tax=Microbacterium TaxID=33882 RepID=UPI00168BE268|nr:MULTISPECIES: hypothetical protein [Microbacterium]QOC24400.1 hypothetical protein IC745_08275 [Microbacterium hominis]QOC28478.1 hypothetical protein IC744_14035 [Microbacterium hominis]QYF96319.1 hypothetical protein KY498_08870 [Microbacterium sp. PAMC21962]